MTHQDDKSGVGRRGQGRSVAPGQSTSSGANDHDTPPNLLEDVQESRGENRNHSYDGRRNSSCTTRRRRRRISPLFDDAPPPPPPPPRPLPPQPLPPHSSSSASWSFSSSSSSDTSLNPAEASSRKYDPIRYLSFIFDSSNLLASEEKESMYQKFLSIKAYLQNLRNDPFCAYAFWYLLQWLRTQNPLFLDDDDEEKQKIEGSGSVAIIVPVDSSSRNKRQTRVLLSIVLEFALSLWEAKSYLEITSKFPEQPIIFLNRRLRRWNTSCSKFLIWIEFLEPCIEMVARATPFLSMNSSGTQRKNFGYWGILNKIEQVKFVARMARLASHYHLWRKRQKQQINLPYLLPISSPHNDLITNDQSAGYENGSCIEDSEDEGGILSNRSSPSLIQRHMVELSTRHLKSSTGTKMVLLADILLYVRPLIWIKAQTLLLAFKNETGANVGERKRADRWKIISNFAAWTACLGIDVVSRYLSKHGLRRQLIERFEVAKQRNNSISSSNPIDPVPPEAFDELKRRKSKWWKYVLRNPVWEMFTQPMTHVTVERILGNIPLVGSILSSYIMSWILYQKCNHFMLEQE